MKHLVVVTCALTLPAAAVPQSEALTFIGDAAGDRFGWSVAALGDVDGDGRGDLAVGAPYNDAFAPDAGQVKVFSGRTHQVLWTWFGSSAQHFYGYAVAATGDVDADGFADVIVGAPGTSTSGYVEVRSGATGAVLHSFASLPSEMLFGAAVAGGGDIDGDSRPDFLIGAPTNGFWSNTGMVRVISGANGALIRRHQDQLNSYNLGASLAMLGDIDGDGRSEYAVGAPSQPPSGLGRVRAYDGASGALLWWQWNSVPPSGGSCSEYGYSLAAIGDVNGNGTPDLVVGDRGDGNIPCPGRGWVDLLDGLDGSELATFTQSTDYSGLGQSVVSVGDIDGDGVQEFAAGAPGSWGPTVATELRVWKYGAPSQLLLTLPPSDADDHFGQSLASGDVSGDGLRDLAVGEPFDDDNGTDSGSVHVYTFVRAPAVYCASEQNSLGCAPAIVGAGTPSATLAQVFDVRASNVLNQKSGLCFYGFKPRQSPFQGGQMCIVAPTMRTPAQSSGGSASGADCTGVFSLDFNARIQSGVDPLLVAGEEIFAQYWSRDPADPSTTNLTDALAFYIYP